MSNRVRPTSRGMKPTTKLLIGSGATLAMLTGMSAAEAAGP